MFNVKFKPSLCPCLSLQLLSPLKKTVPKFPVIESNTALHLIQMQTCLK